MLGEGRGLRSSLLHSVWAQPGSPRREDCEIVHSITLDPVNSLCYSLGHSRGWEGKEGGSAGWPLKVSVMKTIGANDEGLPMPGSIQFFTCLNSVDGS